MINLLTFTALLLFAELAVLWLAYRLGHNNGWLEGWEANKAGKNSLI